MRVNKLLAMAVLALGASFASVPGAEARMTVWDLKVGTKVADMPPWIEFRGYACGSNGGPPLFQLKGWQDYMRCRPDERGLYEVYFEYDDEEEYIARALEDIRIGRVAGTSDNSYPLMLSALFDEAGVLKVLRLITDPRQDFRNDNFYATLKPRDQHHLFGPFLSARFNMNLATDCTKLPLGPGENPVGDTYTKLDCTRVDTAKGVRYVLQTRYFRKPGQLDRDPITGRLTEGQYEASTRAEIQLLE
jgi:hypothetical protein